MSVADFAPAIDRRLGGWSDAEVGRRLWQRDPTIWAPAGTPELADRLGWLRLPDTMGARVPDWLHVADADPDSDSAGTVVVLGMGGSSLAPEVFSTLLDSSRRLVVVDSTHPDTVAGVTADLDPDDTRFVVSSKSGGTLETRSLLDHFWAWVPGSPDERGRAFVAVTDPGSGLAELAAARRFLATFLAPPDVGGRYSALTDFGLVPATFVGIDPVALLDEAAVMAAACGPEVPVPDNPGMRLGAIVGEAALAGRDKLTILTSPGLHGYGPWVEQLVAESLGKDGRGVVPVIDEPVRPVASYGPDRCFMVLVLAGEAAPVDEAGLVGAGHPVVRFDVARRGAIAAEMFRWEVATALAGEVLDVHPFDQPDVEAAKDQARSLMDAPSSGTELPPVLDDAALDEVAASVPVGGYVAVQAYVGSGRLGDVDRVAAALRERTSAPVTIGVGPRFLHSTGQLHKGGGSGCVALQLLDEPEVDLPIPGTALTFGRVIRAQAAGDAAVLAERGRVVVRRTL